MSIQVFGLAISIYKITNTDDLFLSQGLSHRLASNFLYMKMTLNSAPPNYRLLFFMQC